MTDLKEPGLRERKRAQTRRDIERAALRLSLDNGFETVTVDQISDAAGVSPRTFFNYFPSKEQAVVGHSPGLPDDEEVARFLAAGSQEPILESLRLLLAGVIDARGPFDMDDHREIFKMRRDLMVQNPHLFSLRMATMDELEKELVDVVGRRLAADDPALAKKPEALASRARLVAYVAFAGMRHAWSCWAERGGDGDLSTQVRASFAELHELARAGV